MYRRGIVICCSLLLLWGSPALAQTVALLRPPSPSPNKIETLERLRGELLSVGFEVTVCDRLAESEPSTVVSEAWQRSLAAQNEVDAAIDVVGENAPFAVDVWVIDGTQHFRWVARVALDTSTENASKRLAIRASEVLRARLFEAQMGSGDRRRHGIALSPSASAVVSSDETSVRSHQLGIELGAAALASPDGVGPAFLPLVRFDWEVRSEVVVQATLAGFGSRPTIATAAGDARVAMQYGLFGARYRLSVGGRLRPSAALSLGALRTAVEGRAELPRQAHFVEQWSFVVDASVGAVLQLTPRYDATLAAHVQLAEPYVAIRFGDREVASTGRPNLLLTLTFGAWP